MTTSSNYALPCLISLSDLVITMPSLLKVFMRCALSVNQTGLVLLQQRERARAAIARDLEANELVDPSGILLSKLKLQ
eukprot:6174689-Pleurochrysis_carterae.AAC.1